MPKYLLGFVVFLLGVSIVFAKDAIITEREISPGVTYLHKNVPTVPWSVHVLRVDLQHPDLEVVTTLPGGEYIGLTRLTDQAKFIPESRGKPFAGINGDYFRWQLGPYQGDPHGLHIVDGEVTSAPMRFAQIENVRDAAALWMDGKGKARISFVSSQFEITWPDKTKVPFGFNEERANDQVVLYNHCAGLSTKTTNGVELVMDSKVERIGISETYQMRIREIRGPNSLLSTNSIVVSVGPDVPLPKKLKAGSKITVSTKTTPDLRGATLAMGGGPVLVQDGQVTKIPKDQIRHPRAALGCDERHLYFVVVDGRRPGISDGMTYRELAREMASWKVKEAMSIDGGASAMLWIHGEIMNLPSEDRERPNANSIFVLHKASAKTRTR